MRYKILSTGKEIIANQEFVDINFPNDYELIPDEPIVPVIIPPTTIVTKLAFRNRFTQAEKIALYTAASQNIAVQIYLDDVNAATYIDLSRPETIGGVTQLALGGIITTERATEILTNPVQPEEEWKGGL